MLLRKTPLSKKLTSEETEAKLRDVVCSLHLTHVVVSVSIPWFCCGFCFNIMLLLLWFLFQYHVVVVF